MTTTPPPHEPGISMRLLWPFVRLLGTDAESARLLFAYGVGAEQFSDPEARLPYTAAIALLEDRIQSSGNGAIGLEAAELLEPSDVDVLEYACRSCATLGEALNVAVEHFVLLSEAAELSLVVDGDSAKLSYSLSSDVVEPSAAVDFVMASLLRFARRGGSVDCAQVQVWLRHPKPSHVDVYERVLGVPVRFEAPCNAVVMPKSVLGAPMPHADARLAAAFRGRATVMARRLRERAGVTARVREILLAQLGSGKVTMGFVARRVGMSVPTLRRHLEAEGATFSGLLDQVRRQLAERQLRETPRAVWEVAMATGFSNAAAFHRAFKRYTGVSPAEYRERALRPGRSAA